MYHCFNIVTENDGFPAAVLIRAIISENQGHIEGPGKLCKYFGINLTHNVIDITNSTDFYIEEVPRKEKIKFVSSPRIGISKAKERLWRYNLQIS
jgi:DNA-3-methyladenine glycosylase